MTAEFEWLLSEQAEGVMREAATFSDSLTAVSHLRKRYPEVEPQRISQAITQAALRLKLQDRTGMNSDRFFLTQTGLEQATHPAVSTFRANWMTQRYGAALNIVDLTCGLGFDALALAQAGHKVTAYERDESVARYAAHNLKDTNAQVICTDSTLTQLPDDAQVVFADPARRKTTDERTIDGDAQRIYDPEHWSPSWSYLHSMTVPVVAKVAPGIQEAALGEWDAQWISFGGALVETMVNSDGAGQRKAVLISADSHTALVIDGGHASPVSELGEWLIVPDAALIRARALNYWSDNTEAGLVNEHIAWLTTNNLQAAQSLAQQDPSAGKVLRILRKLTLNPRDLAHEIRGIPCSGLTVMTRGVTVNVEQLRKEVLSKTDKSAPELIVALYRDEPRNVALLCQRVTD